VDGQSSFDELQQHFGRLANYLQNIKRQQAASSKAASSTETYTTDDGRRGQ